MKRKAISLFCLMVLLSACAPAGAGTMPTPTKTPTPVVTPTSTAPPELHINYLEYQIVNGQGVARIELSLGSIKETLELCEGQIATLVVLWGEQELRIQLRLEEGGRIRYRQCQEEEELEWRESEYQPLQL